MIERLRQCSIDWQLVEWAFGFAHRNFDIPHNFAVAHSVVSRIVVCWYGWTDCCRWSDLEKLHCQIDYYVVEQVVVEQVVVEQSAVEPSAVGRELAANSRVEHSREMIRTARKGCSQSNDFEPADFGWLYRPIRLWLMARVAAQSMAAMAIVWVSAPTVSEPTVMERSYPLDG